MNQPLITQIQHYSIHDGPGIRTTVFFKGCPLSCRWCHNPETQPVMPTLLFYGERCTGCRACRVCPQEAISWPDGIAELDRTRCAGCGRCAEECLNGARELCGETYTVSALLRLLARDLPFYESSGGGVTLSGGEVLMQEETYLLELVRGLARRGIRVCLDTSGYAPYEKLSQLLPWVDLILYDLKLMDPALHRKYTGVTNGLILRNLQRLSDDGAKLWIRMPLIGGVNDNPAHLLAAADFLQTIRYQQVHLLPYHNAGNGKYPRMGKPDPGEAFTVPAQMQLEEWKTLLEERGIGPVVIGG